MGVIDLYSQLEKLNKRINELETTIENIPIVETTTTAEANKVPIIEKITGTDRTRLLIPRADNSQGERGKAITEPEVEQKFADLYSQFQDLVFEGCPHDGKTYRIVATSSGLLDPVTVSFIEETE